MRKITLARCLGGAENRESKGVSPSRQISGGLPKRIVNLLKDRVLKETRRLK